MGQTFKEKIMKYVLLDKRSGSEKEISYREAKEKISRYYEEIVATYDEMLSEPGIIPMRFSDIRIEA